MEMTPEYAQLSYYVGLAAGIADAYLERVYFTPKFRRDAWEFTWEKLRAMKAEAVEMGVPPEAFARIPNEAIHLAGWGKIVEEIAQEGGLTDEEFLDILERSAPADPDIQALMRDRRRKK